MSPRPPSSPPASLPQHTRTHTPALQRLERLASGLGIEAPSAPLRGNEVELLVNGAMYFPRLLQAIDNAKRSVWLETYLFVDDEVGRSVATALGNAAQRGVEVRVVIDGYGGGEFARTLAKNLKAQGVHVRIYRPERWWRLERKLLRRMHRKLVVVDDAIAFVGGINIIDDYNHPVGEKNRHDLGPRFDFAVRMRGPLVARVALAVRRLWWSLSFTDSLAGGPMAFPRPPRGLRVTPALVDGVTAQLLLRDNVRNRRTIERAYLIEIEAAHHEVLIACAYFLPGHRLRAALRAASRRGVRVRLLLQGRVEYAIQHYAQRSLYADFLASGIEIHEYLPSYLHAKVAVMDNSWATVGSSNIDPYSLLLAREANVVVFDTGFAAQLKSVLEKAINEESQRISPADYARRGFIAKAIGAVAYLLVRFATVVIARGRGY